MKKQTNLLLVTLLILVSGCKKYSIEPAIKAAPSASNSPAASTALAPKTVDSALNNVSGYLRMVLAKDSTATNGILIRFAPSAHMAFVRGEDAPTMQGFGGVSFSSRSSDNVSLAINVIPLTTSGLQVALGVDGNTDGNYALHLAAINSVPAQYAIWLKDALKKDSVDLRTQRSYAFGISHTDTATFSAQRFKVVIRQE